jgi:hypothetical protein
MIKIIISNKGKEELSRFSFNMELALERILHYVPKIDIIGLDHIYITDLPERWKKHLENSSGAYYMKQNNHPAHIELFIKKLFSNVNNPDSLNKMLPFQYIGIAHTVYHEIGHHIEHIRSHGITKKHKEIFSDSYAYKLSYQYALDNADAINACFENIEKEFIEKNFSTVKLYKMRDGWREYYKEAKESHSEK